MMTGKKLKICSNTGSFFLVGYFYREDFDNVVGYLQPINTVYIYLKTGYTFFATFLYLAIHFTCGCTLYENFSCLVTHFL